MSTAAAAYPPLTSTCTHKCTHTHPHKHCMHTWRCTYPRIRSLCWLITQSTAQYAPPTATLPVVWLPKVNYVHYATCYQFGQVHFKATCDHVHLQQLCIPHSRVHAHTSARTHTLCWQSINQGLVNTFMICVSHVQPEIAIRIPLGACRIISMWWKACREHHSEA